MSQATLAAVPSRLSRWLLGLAGALLLALSLAWLYAAQRLGDALHRPAFNGAAFADFCTSSEIAGFPFRLKLTCAGLKAPVSLGGRNLTFVADEAKGAASLWSPTHVLLTFSSPVALQNADGGGFAKLRHDGATLDVTWGLEGLSEAAFSARALDWRPDVIEAGPAFNAQSLNFSAHPITRDGAPALHVEAAVDGLTAPLLQSLLKDSGANSFSVTGDLLPLVPPENNWRQALEDWRLAQGVAHIERGEWRWGALSAQFTGALGLDDAHRLTGALDISAKGAGPLAARLGLPIAPGAANALIGALLGQKQDKPQDPDALALKLRLAQGGLFMGPLQIGGLAPLY